MGFDINIKKGVFVEVIESHSRVSALWCSFVYVSFVICIGHASSYSSVYAPIPCNIVYSAYSIYFSPRFRVVEGHPGEVHVAKVWYKYYILEP